MAWSMGGTENGIVNLDVVFFLSQERVMSVL